VGSFGFLVIYLISGLGSMFLATLLSPLPFLVLLGASGCIMGLLGAMAYLLYRGYIKEKSKIARKSLNIIIFIFVFQVIFDLLTPNVSMTAHLSGFVFGIILTVLLLAFKKERSVA
jgi:rhomboid protease GluP